MYDFAVVGAGPAGTRFARQAAQAGYEVLVLERGEVGPPLACSGHVSLDIWEFTPPGTREAILQNEVHGARFHTGGPNSRGYRFYTDEPISNVIDRVALDRHLAEAAVDAGATIKTDTPVLDVEEGDEAVTLTLRGTDGTETVRARMIAGCDGPVSRVRESLDLPAPGEILHGVLGFDPMADHQNFVDVHLTIPGFFAWRIPRGTAGVEYGLATTRDRPVRDRFETFVEDYGATMDRTCAGAIPIGPPSTVTSHRGFLIGDAAAQTKPFTGGGILYGMTAADLAAEMIDPSDPGSLERYESAWRSELGREIMLGKWLRRAYDLPTPVQRFGLWLTAGEIGVHMDRPTSMFSFSHLRAALRRSRPPDETPSESGP